MASCQWPPSGDPDGGVAADGLATSTTIRPAPSAATSASSAGRRDTTDSARRWNTCSGRSSTPSAPYQ